MRNVIIVIIAGVFLVGGVAFGADSPLFFNYVAGRGFELNDGLSLNGGDLVHEKGDAASSVGIVFNLSYNMNLRNNGGPLTFKSGSNNLLKVESGTLIFGKAGGGMRLKPVQETVDGNNYNFTEISIGDVTTTDKYLNGLILRKGLTGTDADKWGLLGAANSYVFVGGGNAIGDPKGLYISKDAITTDGGLSFSGMMANLDANVKVGGDLSTDSDIITFGPGQTYEHIWSLKNDIVSIKDKSNNLKDFYLKSVVINDVCDGNRCAITQKYINDLYTLDSEVTSPILEWSDINQSRDLYRLAKKTKVNGLYDFYLDMHNHAPY